jgi:hypothetical protein
MRKSCPVILYIYYTLPFRLFHLGSRPDADPTPWPSGDSRVWSLQSRTHMPRRIIYTPANFQNSGPNLVRRALLQPNININININIVFVFLFIVVGFVMGDVREREEGGGWRVYRDSWTAARDSVAVESVFDDIES